jgi:SAM-dependent methyltransferase
LAFNVYSVGHSVAHLFADQYVDSVTAGGLLQKYVAHRRFQSIRSLPRGKLLEVGCGVGYFLRAAAERFSTVGLDNSPAVIEEARKITTTSSLQCTEDLPEGPFDVICGFHVFEHLTDPVQFANAVRKRLNRDGYFYIRVPNRDSTWARLQGTKFFLEGHCSHFSPTSLRRCLELAGFQQINLWTDSFAGRWLATLASPLLALGSRVVQPVNRSYDGQRRSAAISAKLGALTVFHLAQLLADVVSRPALALLNRRGRGEELVAIAKSGP